MKQRPAKVNYIDPLERGLNETVFIEGITAFKGIGGKESVDAFLYYCSENGQITIFCVKDIPINPDENDWLVKGDKLEVHGVFENDDVLVKHNNHFVRLPEETLSPPMLRVHIKVRSKLERLIHPIDPTTPKFIIDVKDGLYDLYEEEEKFVAPLKDLLYHPGVEWEYDKHGVNDTEIEVWKTMIVSNTGGNSDFLSWDREGSSHQDRAKTKEVDEYERIKHVVDTRWKKGKFMIAKDNFFNNILVLFAIAFVLISAVVMHQGMSAKFGSSFAVGSTIAFWVGVLVIAVSYASCQRDLKKIVKLGQERIGVILEKSMKRRTLDIPTTEEVMGLITTFEQKQIDKKEVYTPFWYNYKGYRDLREIYDAELAGINAKYASIASKRTEVEILLD